MVQVAANWLFAERVPIGVGVSRLRAKVSEILRYAISDGVPRRALIFALIVGSILNLINQGDALVRGTPIDVVKLALTYMVPYFSNTYGAVSFRLHAARLTAKRSKPVLAR